MPRPIVEIYQSVANITLTPASPTLPLCIVGPAYKLVQYPANRALKHAYGLRGGWDTPFVLSGGETLAPVQIDAVPYSSFGFVVGAHVVERSSLRAYLENIYYNVKVASNKPEVDGCIITNRRSIDTVDQNISHTLPVGGVKAGDRVIISPLMPQVLYDANAVSAFLTTASAGCKVVIANRTFVVASVIDDHRLVLTENAELALNTLAATGDGTGDEAFLDYTLKTSLDVDIISVVARGKRIRHTPVEGTVQSVQGEFTFTLAQDVKFASGGERLGDPRSKLCLRFERALPASTNGTAPGYSIGGNSITAGDSLLLGGTAPANYMHLTVSGVEVSITRADVFVGARGLIINKPDFITLSSIPADLDFPHIGKAHPDNPLGLAAYVALSNAGGNTIQVLAIESDTSSGYSAALTKLNSHDTVYCIVPLSTDIPNVIAPYKNAAIAMSAPAKGRFRHVIGASAGLPAYKFVGATLGDETHTGETTALSSTFRDDNAEFRAAGVVAGDLVRVTGNWVNGAAVPLVTPVDYVVALVVNEQNLTLRANGGANADPVPAATAVNWVYTIQRSISTDKTAQVAALLARIANVGSHRLTMVYPGECKVLGHSSLPGYYIAAGIGAMVSAFSPHRPKNQTGMAAIEQIYDSNLHFSYDQIDAISDGGYFVMLQDSTEGLAYCVHQLTTGQIGSPGVQEYCELSVVNNFDYVSLFIKRRLSPFVGVWNMTPEAYGAVRSTLDAAISTLKFQSEFQIGAPLVDGRVDSIEKSLTDSGTMIIKVGVNLPTVLNRLQVFLESQ